LRKPVEGKAGGLVKPPGGGLRPGRSDGRREREERRRVCARVSVVSPMGTGARGATARATHMSCTKDFGSGVAPAAPGAGLCMVPRRETMREGPQLPTSIRLRSLSRRTDRE
jgi:hypothetical protein